MHMIRKCRFIPRVLSIPALIGVVFVLSACAGLLPDAKQNTQTPWHSYAEAQAMFEKIIPGKTRLTELKNLGVDPAHTSNVALLSHTDLLRRLLPAAAFDIRYLDPGLQECIKSQNACFAFQIEQISLDRKRFGNFWLDFFNFKRRVNVSGWQFDAVVVVKGDTVVFKQWSGKPSVHQLEEESSPLGPFQSIGPAMVR
ncbi:MAG TPA: hypothetical protein VGE12_11550 [Noviherbaspirillum sp.]